MGALTQNCPKPLLKVAGKTLLDHALDLCKPEIVGKKVVNLHFLGDQIAQHLQGHDSAVSWEDTILETGGGLRAALPLLGASPVGPVVTLNTDAVWTGANPLAELSAAWDDSMDALLLLSPIAQAIGHQGSGDFLTDAAGHLQRANGAPGLVYLGAQIIRTDRLAEVEQAKFSLNLLWDQMIADGRAFGVLHHGGWCDVGHPAAIGLAERMLNG